VEVAIMVGGGNIFRGGRQKGLAIDRATGDYMGMLATVMNGMALQDALEKDGCSTRLLSAIEMHQVAEPFHPAAGDAAPGKRPGSDLRSGNWQPYFFHRYGGGSARHGDQGAGDFESYPGGRCL